MIFARRGFLPTARLWEVAKKIESEGVRQNSQVTSNGIFDTSEATTPIVNQNLVASNVHQFVLHTYIVRMILLMKS